MAEQITYWEYMRKADQTKATLDEIPEASLQTITATEVGKIENTKNIKAVIVDRKIVATVSKSYQLVQHKDAFSPIFNGLHQTATPYVFSLFQTDTKAFLNVFVDEIGDNGSGIKLGFKVVNSIDGRNAISYALSAKNIHRQTSIELVGYRLVCKNGMKIRVPLDQAEELRLEKKTVEKVRELIAMATRIVHMGTEQEIKQKMEAVQYVVEALGILKDPIEQMIKKAKTIKVDEELCKKLISLYIGKRMSGRILEQYGKEQQNLWGVFQAVTNIASHDCTIPTMNGLQNKAAIMLEAELFPKRKVKA
jgi:hypothetical protein